MLDCSKMDCFENNSLKDLSMIHYEAIQFRTYREGKGIRTLDLLMRICPLVHICLFIRLLFFVCFQSGQYSVDVRDFAIADDVTLQTKRSFPPFVFPTSFPVYKLHLHPRTMFLYALGNEVITNQINVFFSTFRIGN